MWTTDLKSAYPSKYIHLVDMKIILREQKHLILVPVPRTSCGTPWTSELFFLKLSVLKINVGGISSTTLGFINNF